MSQNSKLIGILLLAGGGLIIIGCSTISIFSSFGSEGGSMNGAVLGIVLSVFVALPFEAAGIYLLTRARSESAQQGDAPRPRNSLAIVKTRGQIDINDLVFDLNSTTDQVRDDIYRLVGMGLFTGYVNWDKSQLYSKEASKLSGNTCPNCGGEQSFGGKGVITCRYCGTDVFL